MVYRSNLDFGFIKIKGWSNLFTDTEFVQDSTVAICAAVLLFIIPSKANKGEQLLMWTDVKRLPYDIILLFGSGFALAKGFDASGLSDWMAGQLHFLHDVHPYFLILGICVMVCVISEFASNVASIQLVLPILFALSKSMKIDPLILMFPATLAASLGYMLPVATAANTIVFGTKQVPLRHMLKSGFWIDVIGILLISLVGFMI
jgi:sodium-dependent dicarboxylate transporter 2/3/5